MATINPVFIALREKLPHRYMADLQKLLPDLKSKKIWYVMEERCKNDELKDRVISAMKRLIEIHAERKQKLASMQIE